MEERIFAGTVICILCGFGGFTKVSKDIITKNIESKGGIVVKKITQLPDYLTHLIVPFFSTEIKLLKVLKLDTLPNCKIVTPDWAIQSHKLKCLLPEEDFSWICEYKKKMMELESLEFKRKQTEKSDLHAKKLIKTEKGGIEPASKPEKQIESEAIDPIIEENAAKIKTEINEVKVEVKPEFDDDMPIEIKPELNIKLEAKHEDLSRFVTDKRRHANNKNWDLTHYRFFKGKSYGINHNEHLTSVLEELLNNYEILKDKGRSFAYRYAIAKLKSHPEKITTWEQAKGLNKIGDKILKKIKEILETGTLMRVAAMGEQDRLKRLKTFLNIWGVGTTTADKLVSLGYESIEMLKANPPSIFNDNQRIGLELYEELLQKIPRAEVQVITERIQAVAKSLAGERELTAITCGSFRRGRAMCGDIDILMTFEDNGPKTGFLGSLVEELKKTGLITHTLVMSSDDEAHRKHESETFQGIAKLEGGIHRRLDLKVYPRKFYAWAILYFTGSAQFNRSIRWFAKTKGFRLSDEGIFPAIRTRTETFTCASVADCFTEEDIFKLFGMPYKIPEERDI